MLEILALIFLTGRIGRLAVLKGEKPFNWKLAAVLAWIFFEFMGMVVAIMIFGQQNLFAIFSIGIMSAIGGYLIVHYILDKKPNQLDDEIGRIGSDQLRP